MREIFLYLCKQNSKTDILMTGTTAKRNSVSDPKTAISCGLTLSAAIRRIMKSGDNPSAAIPETVIIGDRGLTSLLSTLLLINPQKLHPDNEQQDQIIPSRHHAHRNCGTGEGVYGI
jgi:hypothetical protein